MIVHSAENLQKEKIQYRLEAIRVKLETERRIKSGSENLLKALTKSPSMFCFISINHSNPPFTDFGF
jgi:hypothetical protein